jgi:YjbR
MWGHGRSLVAGSLQPERAQSGRTPADCAVRTQRAVRLSRLWWGSTQVRNLRNVQSYKRHWNTVTLDGTVADDEVQEWIEHSYELVVANLSKRERQALAR